MLRQALTSLAVNAASISIAGSLCASSINVTTADVSGPVVLLPASTESIAGVEYSAAFAVSVGLPGSVTIEGTASGRTAYFLLDAPTGTTLTLDGGHFESARLSDASKMPPSFVDLPPPAAVLIEVRDGLGNVTATCDQVALSDDGGLITPTPCRIPGNSVAVTPLGQPGWPVELPQTGGGWTADQDGQS